MRPLRPLLLVDVDGVVNCFGNLGATTVSFEREFVALDRFTIRVPLGAGAALRLLSATFECVWATTWQEHAPAEIGRRIGVGESWPWVPLDDDRADAMAHKLAAVDRFAGDRAIAWIDDELFEDATEWAARRRAGGRPTLLCRTRENVGLTDSHTDECLEFARTRAKAR